jgi:fructokinase
VSQASGRVVVLGEVLWDVYENSKRLGGAPLNFGAHVRRLGHDVSLISAVGNDELGAEALKTIASLDLDTSFLQTTSQFPTGVATVRQTSDGPQFDIARPAAYDAVELSVDLVKQSVPEWLYYGTLFPSLPHGKRVLDQLLNALTPAMKFYDINLRPGADSPELVRELLRCADIVKLNEEELHLVHEFTGLPNGIEAFCRAGAHRYGWRAVAISLGPRGCAFLTRNEYVEAAAYPVEVVDTVGSGDAFGAALLHGFALMWPAPEIASFANRLGGLVASRYGAIPDWEQG